jgi:hypothetical protein
MRHGSRRCEAPLRGSVKLVNQELTKFTDPLWMSGSGSSPHGSTESSPSPSS